MPSSFSLKGVYKLEAAGKQPTQYCAYAKLDGQEILLPELNLKEALEGMGTDTIAYVKQAERVNKPSDPVFLTVQQIHAALLHIDEKAPENRHAQAGGPDPMGAVA